MGEIPVLIYDGQCAFCRRQASRLSGMSGGRLKLESFHDPGVLERYGVSREACEQAMQLVQPDGQVLNGAAAATAALRLNPALAWLGMLYGLPGIRHVSDALYRAVAKNRHRL